MINSNLIAEDHWTKESTADFETIPCEVANGALVEVTVWIDDFKQPDFDKPLAVMYKGVQVNDLITDEGWDDIKYQVKEWIKSA